MVCGSIHTPAAKPRLVLNRFVPYPIGKCVVTIVIGLQRRIPTTTVIGWPKRRGSEGSDATLKEPTIVELVMPVPTRVVAATDPTVDLIAISMTPLGKQPEGKTAIGLKINQANDVLKKERMVDVR